MREGSGDGPAPGLPLTSEVKGWVVIALLSLSFSFADRGPKCPPSQVVTCSAGAGTTLPGSQWVLSAQHVLTVQGMALLPSLSWSSSSCSHHLCGRRLPPVTTPAEAEAPVPPPPSECWRGFCGHMQWWPEVNRWANVSREGRGLPGLALEPGVGGPTPPLCFPF